VKKASRLIQPPVLHLLFCFLFIDDFIFRTKMAFRRDPFFNDPFFQDFDRDMQDFRKRFFNTSFFGDEPMSSGSLFNRDRPRLGDRMSPGLSGPSAIGSGISGFRGSGPSSRNTTSGTAGGFPPRESWYEREVAPFKSGASKYAGSTIPSEFGRKASGYEGPTIETIPSTCSTPCPSEYSRSSTLRDPLWSPDCPTSPPPSYAASVASEAPTVATPINEHHQPKFSSEIYIPAKDASTTSSGKEYNRKDSVPLSKNVIMEEKDGVKKMKIQLDVGDYAVNEINVTAEDQQLKVHCVKEVEDRDGSLETQEYRKTVKLPESVDPELITSFLSQDGVLTIECVIAVEKEAPKNEVEEHGPITQDEDGNQVIKLQYNVAGFAPEEISVNIAGNTLKMHAFHEESKKGHTTVSREFNKEFELPESADKNSLKYCVEDDQLTVLVQMPKNLFERQLSQEALEGSKLHLEFDVSSFDPEDIQVKIVGTTLKIQAMREEIENNATVCREFSRQCVLPEWVDQNALRSYLTADGKLTIEIPMEKPQEEKRLNVEVRHK